MHIPYLRKNMSEFESLIHLASPGGCLCLWCPCCGWQTKTLHLQGEEVFYKTKTVGAGRWPGRGEVTWSPGHLVTWWSMDSMDSMVSMPKNTVVNYGLQVIHSSFPDDFVGDHDEMMISIDFWTMF